MTELSIITISYNTKEETLDCLKSVYEQTEGVEYEVIVVDNNSEDGSALAIASQFPQVKLIALQENLGFGRANNLAAQEVSSEFILLLNPDTIVLDGAIQKLLKFAQEHPEGGIWGGRTLFADGSLNPYSCWQRMTIWSLFCQAAGLSKIFSQSSIFNPEVFGGWQRDTVRKVDIVSGGLLLIKRSLWEELNGFDPEFFMYGEDDDLSLRARKIGYQPMITPDATIIHYGGASEKVRADKFVKLLRAKVHLIRRHWPAPLREIGVFILSFWPLSRMIILNLAASLWQKESLLTKSQEWSSVWQQRHLWLKGY
ncbi:MAG: glycosyltransferase family 2 protein [Gomphosphaeria aponina SAG 52.96 = DSM 107014]|uniref:Glycosyltransferase family 2 protein n=1 Tax=Gomphosphaeria aponina SAG 52.96 = DSM 107014 TaxID=1521640 RepID=A0A941GST0_9CHRO|nr:glycosyltransferase family 2 protein [Gomphosphaeria aponina SAG 52.96 = DSM 107014]